MRRTSLLGGIAAVAMVGLLSGCVLLGTYNPATDRREFIVIPTSEEVAMGGRFHEQILQRYPLSQDAALTARVEAIGRRLARVSERQDYTYEFYVLASKELNAFTVPGGKIYVFEGLARLLDDDALAAVLAHEIGHCAARHTIKKFQAAVGYDLVAGLLLNKLAAREQVRRIAALSSQALMNLVFSAYSRRDEYEADRLAVRYLDWAGYPPSAMIRALEVLKKQTKDGGPPLFLRSHPYLKDRIEAVRKEIASGRHSGSS